MQPWRSKAIAGLAPGLVVWECETMVYRAGWLRQGLVTPAQLGTCGYLYDTPNRPILRDYWELIWSDKISDAIDFAASSGFDALERAVGSLVDLLSGSTRLLHPLGRGLQVRRLRARPAGRRPPRLPTPAGGPARAGQARDRGGLPQSGVGSSLRIPEAAPRRPSPAWPPTAPGPMALRRGAKRACGRDPSSRAVWPGTTAPMPAPLRDRPPRRLGGGHRPVAAAVRRCRRRRRGRRSPLLRHLPTFYRRRKGDLETGNAISPKSAALFTQGPRRRTAPGAHVRRQDGGPARPGRVRRMTSTSQRPSRGGGGRDPGPTGGGGRGSGVDDGPHQRPGTGAGPVHRTGAPRSTGVRRSDNPDARSARISGP